MVAPRQELPAEFLTMLPKENVDSFNNPLEIPATLMVQRFELRYLSESERMYKIGTKMKFYRDVAADLKRSYFIGTYEGLTYKGLDIAAIKAAPKRYSVLLSDCLEFAKVFCVELLGYCQNALELERNVDRILSGITITESKLEGVSRQTRSLGLFGNSFLGGLDGSTFMSAGQSPKIILMLVLFLLIYPILICVVVVKMFCSP
jgi:hypothetical protein